MKLGDTLTLDIDMHIWMIRAEFIAIRHKPLRYFPQLRLTLEIAQLNNLRIIGYAVESTDQKVI